MPIQGQSADILKRAPASSAQRNLRELGASGQYRSHEIIVERCERGRSDGRQIGKSDVRGGRRIYYEKSQSKLTFLCDEWTSNF
jgi:hypothetical protein